LPTKAKDTEICALLGFEICRFQLKRLKFDELKYSIVYDQGSYVPGVVFKSVSMYGVRRIYVYKFDYNQIIVDFKEKKVK